MLQSTVTWGVLRADANPANSQELAGLPAAPRVCIGIDDHSAKGQIAHRGGIVTQGRSASAMDCGGRAISDDTALRPNTAEFEIPRQAFRPAKGVRKQSPA
jgi:hypothetical protein